MTEPIRTDELVRRMLERRSGATAPDWLLPSLEQAVRANPQAPGEPRPSGWPLRGGRARASLFVAAAFLLVGLAAGALVAGGLLIGEPMPTLPAVAVPPSTSGTPTAADPSASAQATPPTSPRGSTSPVEVVAPAWALPPGWRHDLACDDEAVNCRLHLFDETGREQDGWPVAIPGECGGDVAVGPDDSAFVACTRNGRTIVTGLDRTGDAFAGWPVSLPGWLAWSTWNDFGWGGVLPTIEVGPDETVYLAVTSPDGGQFAIHAIAPDGSARQGWPVELDGGGQGFTVAPDGTVVAWWYEGVEEDIDIQARRTVFTMLAPDGGPLQGWPRGSVGAASGPVISRDGSIFYVSASGKVWAHDRTGEIIDGWPYQLAYPIPPGLRADGSLLFVEDSRVVVLDLHGNVVPGWPYRTKGTLTGPGCDTPGFPYPVVATASDGTLYLAPWVGTKSSIVALRPDGASAAGWPYRVPPGWRVTSLEAAPDGTVTASLSGDPCGEGFDATSIRLTPGGILIGEPPPTPLSVVYEAMRLDGPRASGGGTTYAPGVPIQFEFELINRSEATIELPLVDYYGDSWYAAGTLQTWIERLGPQPEIDCLPGAGRKGAWYATGGWIQVSANPTSIAPGGSMSPLLQGSLDPTTTGCLPPGDYRYHVEFKPLDGYEEDVIDHRFAGFRIVSGPTAMPTPATTPTVTPTPRPPPTPPTTPLPSAPAGPSPSPT